ncbi:Q-nucleotide N-glycosylase 1-like isoform X2 [Ostrea edulis]|uniref:Q-nucleotide N-glycosylase 1-like isoform X2 n=1 Tax=Ostrea edulis TaxID=37623 RepID=UPI0024AFF721|nr:Q-nucleotide N-glycosylase 1-like isoform X2 [Ostrea edulis]
MLENATAKMYECAQKNNYTLKSWRADHELNPRDQNEAALDWVFVADTLNFSFWSDDESHKYCIKYKGREYTGYWSWCAALNRALDNGVRITDASFYADIDEKKLAEILKSDSDVPIPLLEQRVDVLREAGKVLMEKYDGKFSNCIKACNKSAQSLMQLVVRDFPSYRDEAEYQRKRVSIYKRAQILVADIWACFEGTRFGEFLDIDTITMFADYRIPQALYHFGALSYSDELMEYLKAGNMMKSGDRYEVEIRGCSIWATELVAERANELIKKDPSLKDVVMNSILIDHYLWDFRRDHAEEMRDNIPFHRIRCIYY